MKKIIFITVFLITAVNLQLSAQISDSLYNVINHHTEARTLLKKADRQKTISKVLAAGAIVVNIICILDAASHSLDGMFYNWNPFAQDLPTNSSQNNTSPDYKSSNLLLMGAMALTAGSITYGLIARKNKKKARLMLRTESVFFNPDLNLKDHLVSLGIKITL